MSDRWRRIGPAGYFFECPRWRDDTWWIADFYAGELLNLTADGEVLRTVAVPGRPGGIGWLRDGTMVVVSQLEKRLYTVRDGRLEEYADLSSLAPARLNDMVIASNDVAYVGNHGFELSDDATVRSTVLIGVGPDRKPFVAAEDLMFPNGTVVTADGGTLIVAETFAARHTAYDLAPDGSLSSPRTWYAYRAEVPTGTVGHVLETLSYAPDGCAIDERDHVWATDAIHGRVLHVSASGELVEALALPAGLNPFACAFGGPDGRQLLVTAAPSFVEEQRIEAPASVLLVLER